MEENIPTLPPETQTIHKRIILNHKSRRFLLVVLLLILVCSPSYYFYNQYQKSQNLLISTGAIVNVQDNELITAVGMLIMLPTNEQPRIATVNDKNQLPLNPFFANAENGDKVLIYSQAKKAILYRPSINKIIEVSVLDIESNNPTPAVSASPSATFVHNVSPSPVPVPTSTPAPTAVPAQ
jgi:hypothetical protein